MMNRRTILNLACLFSNSINVICFTVLAIAFDTWWLVLFAGLFNTFVNSEKEKEEPNE